MLRLIDAAANDSSRTRTDGTKDQFAIDANAILEALLLEYGVEAAVQAVARHGFKGQYRQTAQPLYDFAVQRRSARQSTAV